MSGTHSAFHTADQSPLVCIGGGAGALGAADVLAGVVAELDFDEADCADIRALPLPLSLEDISVQ